jgi:hypothetical protein
MDPSVPEARIDIFPGHPAPAAERQPGKLSERIARVFSRQRSEEVQGRKKILSAKREFFPGSEANGCRVEKISSVRRNLMVLFSGL